MAVSRPEPVGYEQVTDLSSASGLTVPSGADFALVQAVTQDVRWRDDGTSPTGSVGMVLAAGDTLSYDGDLSTFEAIETSASAELNVAYYVGGQ